MTDLETGLIKSALHPFSECYVRCGPVDQICLGDPDPEKINLDYITNCLSGLNRFLGYTNDAHFKRINVLEHSIYVYMTLVTELGQREAMSQRKLMRTALAHDFPEAYTGDIISPIKACWPAYQEWEATIMWPVLAKKYDLLDPIPEIIHAIDKAVRVEEMKLILGVGGRPDSTFYRHNIAPESIEMYFRDHWQLVAPYDRSKV